MATAMLGPVGLRASRGDDERLPADTVVTMLRGACERRCPVYRVAIFEDGTAIVEGEHYLRKPILAKTTLPRDDVKRLIAAFKALDYFHLEDAYGYQGKGCTSTKASDEQVVVTTLVSGGQGKSIAHHHGCLGAIPDRLTALEDTIDRTAQSARLLKPALRK